MSPVDYERALAAGQVAEMSLTSLPPRMPRCSPLSRSFLSGQGLRSGSYMAAITKQGQARSAKSQCPYFEGNPGLLVGVGSGSGGFSLGPVRKWCFGVVCLESRGALGWEMAGGQLVMSGPAPIAGIGQEATWTSH
jgi:hypothetical protein